MKTSLDVSPPSAVASGFLSALPLVASALANTVTNDIRGIKPPVHIPNPWAVSWWQLAVGLLGTALLLWWQHRRRAELPPILYAPPHLRAKQRLEEALRWITEPNRFCTRVADTIRVYLEERFRLRAPERTTEEFLLELAKSPHLTPDQKQSLGEFLQSCDLVKFARFEPTETALRQLHEAALRLVDETQFDPITTVPAMPPSPALNAVS